MPTYVYEVVNPDGSEGETFEVFQRMSDPPLTQHPTTGKPVRRIIAPVAALTKFGTGSSLSNSAANRVGFTKYVKNSDGGYSKVAGRGPANIRQPKR